MFDEMSSPSERRQKYTQRAVNYSKMTFFLVFGFITLAIGGVITGYFALVVAPDDEYHERTAKSTRLLDDYVSKSNLLRQSSKPSDEQQSSVSDARSKYLSNLRELVDFCQSHQYMPDSKGRLDAREKELHMSGHLP